MRRAEKSYFLSGFLSGLDRFKEGFVDFFAFRALLEMMTYTGKKLACILPRNLKVHIAWQDVEKFRAKHFLILDSKNGLN